MFGVKRLIVALQFEKQKSEETCLMYKYHEPEGVHAPTTSEIRTVEFSRKIAHITSSGHNNFSIIRVKLPRRDFVNLKYTAI